MNKITTVLIIILVLIIAIFWIPSLFDNQKNNDQIITIDCGGACHNIKIRGWIFPGAGPNVFFQTKDECVSACKNRR